MLQTNPSTPYKQKKLEKCVEKIKKKRFVRLECMGQSNPKMK
uniref:Uncharacterized protein n=1 Tax=Rhizophora mucronata TaxID=61149 RepID=A0A2P2QY00_RHIMU